MAASQLFTPVITGNGGVFIILLLGDGILTPGPECSSILLPLTGKENEHALSTPKFCAFLTWFSVSESYTLQLCINREVWLLKYPEALLGYLKETIKFELIRWKHQREVIGIYVLA